MASGEVLLEATTPLDPPTAADERGGRMRVVRLFVGAAALSLIAGALWLALPR